MRVFTLDRALAAEHYKEHAQQDWIEEVLDDITAGTVVATILEGPEAIMAARQIIGATDPTQATTGSIRGDLALIKRYNLVHGADSEEAAAREIKLYFQ